MKNFWRKLKQPILALAPMAGVTDSAFRLVCRELGADVVYTEMVSADGLYYDAKKTLALLKFYRRERPTVIQLFGKNPATFTKAAAICEQAGFNGVDINFGCPAKKVTAHGGGVTLMRDLKKCRQIVEAVLGGTKLPVSVKLRTSIKNGATTVTALDFIKFMGSLPISAVMIHGRSYEDYFSGPINFAMIKAVKENFAGLVLGNGGIDMPEDAQEMLEKTGCDGLGLARGVRGKPWLFDQIKVFLAQGRYDDFEVAKIKKVMIGHAKLAFGSKGERGIIELRKHLTWYTAGWPQAKKLRSRLVKVKSVKELKNILSEV